MLDLAWGPWWYVHLSAKMDSSAKDSGRLVISSLLLVHPKPVSLQGSTVFLIRASCGKTTHARGYYHAWPRWTGSVNGSLTVRAGDHILDKTRVTLKGQGS